MKTYHVKTLFSRNFQNSNVFGTGLSDYQKISATVFKQYLPKFKPKEVNYRDY